jgi:hypothetical protein
VLDAEEVIAFRGHEEQLVRPELFEYFPISQGMHFEFISKLLKKPGIHSTQDSSRTDEYLPGPHFSQFPSLNTEPSWQISTQSSRPREVFPMEH